MYRRILCVFLLTCCACAFNAQGQAISLLLDGAITDHDSGKPLRTAVVIATDTADSSMVVRDKVDTHGRYALRLPYDRVFRVVFTAEGAVPKEVLMDLAGPHGKARDAGYTMTLEMELFARVPGVDYSALDEPVAICRYAKRGKEFTWDEAYTQARLPLLTALTEAHAAQLKKIGEAEHH